jgi:uracil-DNA glycosylase
MPPIPNRDGRSPLQVYKDRWAAGCGADDCCRRGTRVVLFRGSVPCDVLVVGEAPGESENVLGRPFVGPAGQLMDKIMARALDGVEYCAACKRGNHWNVVRFGAGHESPTCDDGHYERGDPLKVAFTNVVGCIPREEDGGKAAAPSDEQTKACRPRLQAFVDLCRPRLVVAVGNDAKAALEQGMKGAVALRKGTKLVNVVHPAYVLRANVAQQGLLVQRCVVTIGNAAEDL